MHYSLKKKIYNNNHKHIAIALLSLWFWVSRKLSVIIAIYENKAVLNGLVKVLGFMITNDY